MGTWGPGLFSDDVASDVRDEYRDLIGEGVDGPEATDQMIDRWRGDLHDPDAGPVFWLALAATQWRVGRLEDRVRLEALRIIDGGVDLRRWADAPQVMSRRRTVLERLRVELNTPQPPAKKIPRPFRSSCDWRVGEVVVLQRTSGTPVVFRTLDHHSDRGGVAPVCDVLEWTGAAIPSERDVAKARPRRFIPPWDDGRAAAIILGATKAREVPIDRLVRVGIIKAPGALSRQRRLVVLWRDVERKLRDLYGI